MPTPLAYMYFSFEEDGWQASKLSTTTLNARCRTLFKLLSILKSTHTAQHIL